MIITSYNCLGYKSNTKFITELINNSEITFLTEHWLNEGEESMVINNYPNHKILFQSDIAIENISKFKGRPHGGKCWVIHNSINILDYMIFNESLSMVKLKKNNFEFIIFGTWIPFDNGSLERYMFYKSIVAFLESYSKDSEHPILMIGDFNSDLKRKKRYDLLLNEFIQTNKLIDGISVFKKTIDYSYVKNNYKALIDHIIYNDVLNKYVDCCTIIDEPGDLSDHRPVRIILKDNIYMINVNHRYD